MLTWISANMGTIIITIVLAAIVALVVAVMVRDKKKGRSACGCKCAGCPMSGSCHNH